MGRWEPDAAGRLAQAAVELYRERGYDRTTVADIADRAGVTARTYFRHYADKREVLFAGSQELQDSMATAVAAAAPDASPLEALDAALDVAGERLGGRRAYARERHAVISSSPELLERELVKMARVTGALTGALEARGTEADEARLVAETGVTAFRVGFDRWLVQDRADLADTLRLVLGELLALRRPS